jgi:outer membrane protein TolC
MEIKNRILDAAIRVFAETGYRGATTRRIAQVADVNEVTLFRHFGSKEELLQQALQQVSLEEADIALPEEPVDPERELTTWARTQHAHIMRMSSVIRTCMGESEEHPELARCAQNRPMRVANELSGYLKKLQKRGLADAHLDVPTATAMLMGALFNDALGRSVMPDLFKQPASTAPARYVKLFLKAVTAIALLLTVGSHAAVAQSPQSLSLDEAMSLARAQSEQISIAQAGVTRARGQQYQARSLYLPQLFGSLGYTRTLASEFSALRSDTSSTDTLPTFLKDLPFGRTNQFNLGLSVSQNVFTGGRVQAANRIANASRHTAEINLASAEAQLLLDVTQAYYDAALSERMLAIAEATLQQAETTLVQAKLARQVGDKPEFELLRAQVTRDTQQPVVIQRRTDRDVAYIRLKQLLNIPLDQALQLATPLGDDHLPVAVVQASAHEAASDTVIDARAPVQQAVEAVHVQEGQLRIASAQHLPSLSISSQYGRVAYPESFALPAWNQFHSNWTIGASLQLPIFTGGRIHGDELVARANLEEARARLQQARELAALDTRNTVQRLTSAEAAWRASSGTVEQATRAYQIAEIRYREGISTQLELSDARILLQAAQANRALAARDLQIARARVALIRDLPIQITQTGTRTP